MLFTRLFYDKREQQTQEIDISPDSTYFRLREVLLIYLPREVALSAPMTSEHGPHHSQGEGDKEPDGKNLKNGGKM